MKNKSIALFFVIIISGCTHFSAPYPEVTYHAFTQEIHEEAKAPKKELINIKLEPFSIARQFESPFFVYRVTEYTFETDFYNRFASFPALFFAEQLQHYLHTSYQFAFNPNYADCIISVHISELYVDYIDKKNPSAVISIDATVKEAKEKKVILAKSYKSTIKMETSNIKSIMPAFQKAEYEIMAELKKDLISLLSKK